MAVGDAHVFPGVLSPILTKPLTTFLTFLRGERRTYAGKKVCLNRVSNLQPPGHESDTLTTESPWRGLSGFCMLNSLSNDKHLDPSKFKPFTDDEINVTVKFKFISGRVEPIAGKGENAGYQHFLLFPQCFQGRLKPGL